MRYYRTRAKYSLPIYKVRLLRENDTVWRYLILAIAMMNLSKMKPSKVSFIVERFYAQLCGKVSLGLILGF